MNPLTAGVVIGTAFGAGVLIDENAIIPLGTAAAVGGLIFWVGRKWQKIDDKLEALDEKVNNLPCSPRGCPQKEKGDII